ncbi:MAG: hypothetical protein AB7Q17_05235 [Phycisphaerae bacterium]
MRRRWLALAGVAAVAALGAYVGTQIFWIRYYTPDKHVTPFEPTTQAPLASADWAARLLAATSAAARDEARTELRRIGPASAADLASALRAAVQVRRLAPGSARNARVAIALLAEFRAPVARAALEDCAAHDELCEDALLGRAWLGDERALGDTVRVWQKRVRDAIFAKRLAEFAIGDARAHADAHLERRRRALTQAAGATARLGQPAMDLVVAGYWDSWGWLGQQRAEDYVLATFETAKLVTEEGAAPRTDPDPVVQVRGARRVLDQTATYGALAVRAAAVLTLAQCTPQYKSLRERIVDGLAAALPSGDALEQQRVVWTLAHITGRGFGDFSAADPPNTVNADHVAAATAWARQEGVGVAAAARKPHVFPPPPVLERRVLTAERQLEEVLLAALRTGWADAAEARRRWLGARLGFTPRIAACLDATMRDPHLPALCAALTAAGAYHAEGSRAQLEVWRHANDQPPWVRALAYTALAALDAPRGPLAAAWPAGLDATALLALDAESPGWEPFGEVLLAAGPTLVGKLQKAAPGGLPDAIRAKLLRAADAAAQRHGVSLR